MPSVDGVSLGYVSTSYLQVVNVTNKASHELGGEGARDIHMRADIMRAPSDPCSSPIIHS
jgi:hypothetical protein